MVRTLCLSLASIIVALSSFCPASADDERMGVSTLPAAIREATDKAMREAAQGVATGVTWSRAVVRNEEAMLSTNGVHLGTLVR